jgi:AraC-like DNA-binding protein
MPGKRHGADEVARRLEEADRLLAEGKPPSEVARALGISLPTYYRWRKVYGGLSQDNIGELKRLQTENTALRRQVADAEKENAALRELVRGKF